MLIAWNRYVFFNPIQVPIQNATNAQVSSQWIILQLKLLKKVIYWQKMKAKKLDINLLTRFYPKLKSIKLLIMKILPNYYCF